MELTVGVLAGLREQGERRLHGDLVGLHQDALCLADHVPAAQRHGDVAEVLVISDRDRGVAGEGQSDPLGLVGEDPGSASQQVQRRRLTSWTNRWKHSTLATPAPPGQHPVALTLGDERGHQDAGVVESHQAAQVCLPRLDVPLDHVDVRRRDTSPHVR